jgi:hypothetical protein
MLRTEKSGTYTSHESTMNVNVGDICVVAVASTGTEHTYSLSDDIFDQKNE